MNSNWIYTTAGGIKQSFKALELAKQQEKKKNYVRNSSNTR
jgi:hypothetical protein